jgi:hypothetical protein
MKRTILLIATSFLIASSLHAVPLTWRFSGTTSSSTEFNGTPIAQGLNYELRIFLDTDLLGMKDPTLADVFFFGPHQGEVEIETLGVLPVDQFLDVQYFAPGGLVTGVQFNEFNAGFSGIQFNSSISGDSMHLGPIAPTAPNVFNTVSFSGPNGLFGSLEVVNTFSATTVPDETDADADGVPDSLDQCPDTPAADVVNAQGCSIDQLVPCSGPASGGTWKNHGKYVSRIAHVSKTFVKAGLISARERGRIVSAAARSGCGKKPKKHH